MVGGTRVLNPYLFTWGVYIVQGQDIHLEFIGQYWVQLLVCHVLLDAFHWFHTVHIIYVKETNSFCYSPVDDYDPVTKRDMERDSDDWICHQWAG